MKNTIIIGSRGSALALVQARYAAELVRKVRPGALVRIEVIRTQGDEAADVPLEQMGGVGVFTKAIERQLLMGKIDLAVHSMKDLATVECEGLMIGGVPVRESAADVLVSQDYATIEEIPEGGVVLCGSVRRRAMLRYKRGDLRLEGIRGNVPTRLEKYERSGAAGMILAAAGLRRLGRGEVIREELGLSEFVPAAGQGALALQIRDEDAALGELLAEVNDAGSYAAVMVERAIMRRLGGGCHTPMGVYAQVDGTGERVTVDAVVMRDDGGRRLYCRDEETLGKRDELIERVVKDLNGQGAQELIHGGDDGAGNGRASGGTSTTEGA